VKLAVKLYKVTLKNNNANTMVSDVK